MSAMTRSKARVSRFFTKMSTKPFVSSATSVRAYDSKATSLPSALMDGYWLAHDSYGKAVAPTSALVVLTRSMATPSTSATNTSVQSFVSLGTMRVAVAWHSNATRPTSDIDGRPQWPVGTLPSYPRLTHSVNHVNVVMPLMSLT